MRSKILFLALIPFFLCSCQQMEAGEYGVLFYKLPPWLGGGVSSSVKQPGEMVFEFPWMDVIRVDTSTQQLAWGGFGEGDDPKVDDYVETRARDGNEVGLAIKVQYRVNPKMISHLVQRVGIDKEKIQNIVASVARADVRTHMNVLNTRDFFNQQKRQAAVDQVKEAMDRRLRPEGIIIEEVLNTQHRFERPLSDGKYDRTCQEKIDSTYASVQETEAEKIKVSAVIEQKKKEYNEELAKVNRLLEEAQGGKQQSVLRGDSYLQAKKIEAEQIAVVGANEIEALQKRIAALAGAGGEAILKLELVKALSKANPKYVVVDSGKTKNAGGLDLTKIDANELIRQAGIMGIAPEMLDSNKKTQKKNSNIQAK